MPADLVTKLLEFIDAAVGGSPEEPVQFFLCLIRIVHMKNEPQLLFQQVPTIQTFIADRDFSQLRFLLVGQVFRCFP